MERVVHTAEARGAGASAVCVSCRGEVDGPRCDHCGAAVTAGAFRIRRLISQGPHGRMYLAEDPEGREVALKELSFSLVPGAEQVDAFEREARVLIELRHPKVPAFVGNFSEGRGVHTRLYLAQQFIAGETLLRRLEREKLSEEDAWKVAEEVLEILVDLHSRTPAVLHRDIKPANLIIRPDGSIALVDFGAVRNVANGVTHGSTLVGTFGYMPAEQLGGTVDATSDLYALGATLIHALTQIAPSELVTDGMELAFAGKVRGSEALLAFIGRLVASRRGARFPSAEAALDFLRQQPAGAVAPVAEAHSAEAPVGRSRSSRRAIFAGVAGAAMLLVVLAGLFLLRAPAPMPVFEPGLADPTPGSPVIAPGPGPVAPGGGGPHRNFRTPWPAQQRSP